MTKDKEELTTYSSTNSLYFVGYEITKLLGYKNHSYTINKISECNRLIFRDYSGEKIPKINSRTILINRDGVNEILNKTIKNINPDIKRILEKYDVQVITEKSVRNRVVERDLNEDEYVKINYINDNEVTKSYEELTTYPYTNNGSCFKYFIGHEIAELFGYTKPRHIIRNKVSDDNKLLFRDYCGVKIPSINPRTVLLNSDGVKEILNKTRKTITPDVKRILEKYGIYDSSFNRVCDQIARPENTKNHSETDQFGSFELQTLPIARQTNIDKNSDSSDYAKIVYIDDDEEIQEDKKELTTYSYINNGTCFEYFVGYEITTIIGYKNPSKTIKNSVSKCNQLTFRDYPGVKIPAINPRSILINSDGINEILNKTHKTITTGVTYILKKFGIEVTNSICLTTEEQNLESIDEEVTEYSNELATYSYINNGYYFEYFVGYEIVSLVGYKNPTQIVKNSVSKCNQLLFREYPGVKIPPIDPRTILVNSDGVKEILLKTRKTVTPDVKFILKEFGIDITNSKCLSKEQQTFLAIENAFKGEKMVDQYRIGKYYLDMYFPDYNLVIECDENGHQDRKPWAERERMNFVNKKLSITDDSWVRYNPDASDFDITRVIGKINQKINLYKRLTNTQTEEVISIPKKACTYCNVSKRLIEFNNAKDHRDGKENICKICKRKKDMERIQKFRENNALPTEKRCNICNGNKLIEEFYRDKHAPDGRCRRCKACDKAKKATPKAYVFITEKRCTSCKAKKEVSEFYKDPSSRDGYKIYCSDCSRAKGRIEYDKNRDKILETKRIKRKSS